MQIPQRDLPVQHKNSHEMYLIWNDIRTILVRIRNNTKKNPHNRGQKIESFIRYLATDTSIILICQASGKFVTSEKVHRQAANNIGALVALSKSLLLFRETMLVKQMHIL